MAYWFLGGGLVLLLFGSEAVVRGGVAFSSAFNLPPLLIGLLVITTGTSAPEFAVSLEAAQTGAPDIALANIVGSNILNLLLILGLAASSVRFRVRPKSFFATAARCCLPPRPSRPWPMTDIFRASKDVRLLVAFLAYLVLTFFTDWRRSAEHSVSCAHAIMHFDGDTPSATGGVFFSLRFRRRRAGGAFHPGRRGGIRARSPSLAGLVGLTVVAFAASAPDLDRDHGRARAQAKRHRGRTSDRFQRVQQSGCAGTDGRRRGACVNPMLKTDLLVMAGAGAILLPLLTLDGACRVAAALLVLSYACYLVFLVWRRDGFQPS